jgi:hypothetical protein
VTRTIVNKFVSAVFAIDRHIPQADTLSSVSRQTTSVTCGTSRATVLYHKIPYSREDRSTARSERRIHDNAFSGHFIRVPDVAQQAGVRDRGDSFIGSGNRANTTIFSVINGTLLNALPYAAPHRLMILWTVPLNRPEARNSVTAQQYLAWKNDSKSFSAIGG